MPSRGPAFPARRLLVIATVLCALAGHAGAEEQTPVPRLVEVELAPGVSFDRLLEAGLDVVEVRGPRRARILERAGDEVVLGRLAATVRVIDADPARSAAERARAELAARPAPRGTRVWSATQPDGIFRTEVLPPFGSGSMAGYWTLAEVKMKLDELVALDSQSLVADKIDTIGTSRQGRPIWGLKIAKAVGGPDTRPVAFYNALTHAREPEGMQALFYFVDDLLAKYGTDPTATYLLENRRIYIVPVVNPDGYFRNQSTNPMGGGFWRKNLRDNDNNGTITSQDGVDINRNYGYQWGFDNLGSSPTMSAETYRGPSPFSEPETQAQRDIVVALQPKTGLSFHTYSDLLLRGWGYTTTAPPDSNAFYEWEDDMSLGNGYLTGQGIRVLYPVNGEFNDWTYGDTGLKPRGWTWTPEVGGPDDGFWPPPSRIVPLAEENLRAAYYVASIAGPHVRVERANVIGGPLFAGSALWVQVRARNKGVSGATAGPGLVATMASLSAGASVLSGAASYPTLASLTSADASDGGKFLVAVDDTVTAGRLLRLRVDFSAPGGYFSRDTVELVCGLPTVLAVHSGSPLPGEWTTVSWGTVANDPVHPSTYYADSPSGTYADNSNNSLTRVANLDLSPGVHAYVIYDARWQFESDYDCGLIEASVDSITWTPLRATGSSLGRASSGVQPVGQPVYDGARYRWKEERADLSPFTGPAGNVVRLRYRVLSDLGSRLDGLNVDSVRVLLYDPAAQPSPVAVGGDDAPGRIELAAPAPDPVRGSARLSFVTPAAGDVRLDLFDLQGRHVRTLAAGSLPPGRYARLWDARDDAGRPVAAGVYLARLQAPAQGEAGVATRRFVVLN